MSSPNDQAVELCELIEAEIASLREETMVAMGTRHKFITLRIAYLEKQLPDMREKAGKARINAEWLARINHPKRS